MFFLGWLFFSVAAGMFAQIRRNRNGAGWFMIAIIFSPLVAFILAAILKPAPTLDPVAAHRVELVVAYCTLAAIAALPLAILVGAIFT